MTAPRWSIHHHNGVGALRAGQFEAAIRVLVNTYPDDLPVVRYFVATCPSDVRALAEHKPAALRLWAQLRREWYSVIVVYWLHDHGHEPPRVSLPPAAEAIMERIADAPLPHPQLADRPPQRRDARGRFLPRPTR